MYMIVWGDGLCVLKIKEYNNFGRSVRANVLIIL